jgi:hypothetical protein
MTKTEALGGIPTSHIPAHESQIAVAPFRAWPSSPVIIARGPMGLPLSCFNSLRQSGRIITNSLALIKCYLTNLCIFSLDAFIKGFYCL